MPSVPDNGNNLGAEWLGALSKSVSNTQSETKKMLESAENGGFRISPEGIKPLKEALIRMQERLDSLGDVDFRKVTQKVQLGSHPYGQEVSNHVMKSVDREELSARKVISQLRKLIEDADASLDKALENYREHEKETADTLSKKRI